MKRVLREFRHDLREISGHLAAAGIIGILFVVTAYFVQVNLDRQDLPNTVTLPALEALIPSLGAYGTLMLMQALLDTEGGELGFTYARTPLYWGLIRQARFFGLYGAAAALVCAAIAAIMWIPWVNLFTLTLLQGYAVMGIGFLALCATRKVSMGLVLVAAFVCLQLMLYRDLPQLNFIYSLTGMAPEGYVLDVLVPRCLAIGTFGWGIGQLWLRPR